LARDLPSRDELRIGPIRLLIFEHFRQAWRGCPGPGPLLLTLSLPFLSHRRGENPLSCVLIIHALPQEQLARVTRSLPSSLRLIFTLWPLQDSIIVEMDHGPPDITTFASPKQAFTCHSPCIYDLHESWDRMITKPFGTTSGAMANIVGPFIDIYPRVPTATIVMPSRVGKDTYRTTEFTRHQIRRHDTQSIEEGPIAYLLLLSRITNLTYYSRLSMAQSCCTCRV